MLYPKIGIRPVIDGRWAASSARTHGPDSAPRTRNPPITAPVPPMARCISKRRSLCRRTDRNDCRPKVPGLWLHEERIAFAVRFSFAEDTGGNDAEKET